MENKEEVFEKFWADKQNPLQAHDTEEWFDKYYKEVLFHLPKRKILLDAGCGSGELTLRLAKDFEKVIGIDLSESMLNALNRTAIKKGINNVVAYNANAMDINKVVKEIVDVVFNNTLMQYLSIQQIEEFVFRSNDLLAENGVILLMNIPNANLKDLYYINVFKSTKNRITSTEMIKEIIAFKYSIFKQKIKNRKYEYDPIFGYWHYPADFVEIGEKLGIRVEIFQSIYQPYGYRFHAKFSKRND